MSLNVRPVSDGNLSLNVRPVSDGNLSECAAGIRRQLVDEGEGHQTDRLRDASLERWVHVYRHVHGHVYRHVYRHAHTCAHRHPLGHVPLHLLEGSRRGGQKEYQHVNTRAPDMPSAMPMRVSKCAARMLVDVEEGDWMDRPSAQPGLIFFELTWQRP